MLSTSGVKHPESTRRAAGEPTSAKVGSSTSLSAVRNAGEHDPNIIMVTLWFWQGARTALPQPGSTSHAWAVKDRKPPRAHSALYVVPSNQWKVQGLVSYLVLHVGGLGCVFEIAQCAGWVRAALLRNDTCGTWVVAVAGNPVWPSGTQQPQAAQAPHLLDPRPSPSIGAPSSVSSFYWLQWPSIKHCRGHGWAVEAWAAMGQVFNVRRWFKLARGTHINAQLIPTLPSAHAKDSHLCNDPCFCVRIQHAHVVQGKWGLVALRTAQAAVRCQRAAGCRRFAPARAAPASGTEKPVKNLFWKQVLFLQKTCKQERLRLGGPDLGVTESQQLQFCFSEACIGREYDDSHY
jgi:hypothetical protein